MSIGRAWINVVPPAQPMAEEASRVVIGVLLDELFNG